MQKTLKFGLSKSNDDQFVETDETTTKYEYNKLQQTRISSELLSSKSLSQIIYIKYSESIINNLQNCIADSALFQSHRFRINWSMNPTATTFTHLDLNMAMTNMQLVNLISPISTVSKNNCLETDNSKLITTQTNCIKYLNTQLEYTDFIEKNNATSNKLPLLRTKPGNELIRHFYETTLEIRNKIG